MTNVWDTSDRDSGAAAAFVQRFAPTNWQRIQELRFKKRLYQAPGYLPLVTVCFAFTAALILLCGIFIVPEAVLVREIGGIFLILTVPLLALEALFKVVAVRLRTAALHPLLGELRDLQRVLGDYLADLDRRTSRFFHCVTNTKVTNYFMLRQIEHVLADKSENLGHLLASPSIRNLENALEILQGIVEYHDGFVFNQGRSFQLPVSQVPVRIQELVSDLERGVSQLEYEIQSYREQAARLAEPRDVQIPASDGKE